MSAQRETAPRSYTADDLWRLSGEGKRYELVRGVLRDLPLLGARQGTAGARMVYHLGWVTELLELGESFISKPGFWLERNPDTVLAPDWAYVRKDRCPEEWGDDYPELAPDAVLEVLTAGASERKISEWLDAGVLLVLALDCERNTLTAYRPGAAPTEFGPDDEFIDEAVLPDLYVPLSYVFRTRPALLPGVILN